MQTFMPYPSFAESAKVLDFKRLGKQRVEAYQLILIHYNVTENSRWRRHPAFKMWTGHRQALVAYALTMCAVWKERGYKDTLTERIISIVLDSGEVDFAASMRLATTESVYEFQDRVARVPHWVGNPVFHMSHCSNLIRKRPDVYEQIWPNVDPSLPYVWPMGGV